MEKKYTACLHKMGKGFKQPQIHIVTLEKIPGHFIDRTSVSKKFIVLENEYDTCFMFHSERIEKLFFINGEYVMYSFKKKRKLFLEKIIEVEESESACINDEVFLNECKNKLLELASEEVCE